MVARFFFFVAALIMLATPGPLDLLLYDPLVYGSRHILGRADKR